MSRMLDLTSEEYGRLAAQNKVSENFENLIPHVSAAVETKHRPASKLNNGC